MERTALARLLRESPKVSGAHVVVDPRLEFAFFTRLKGTPAVASVFTRRAMRDNIRATMARTMMISLSFLGHCWQALSHSASCTTPRGSLFPSGHGNSRRYASSVSLAGKWLSSSSPKRPSSYCWRCLLVSSPATCEATLVSAAYDSEQFRIPVSFRRSSYGFAAVVVTTAALLSGAVVWRLIGRLDLIGVLKTRE